MFHLTLLFNRCDSTSYKLILYINHNTPFLIPFLCFMKKLLLLLIILTTLTNLSYASFPVFSSIKEVEPKPDSNLILTILIIIFSIVRLIYNKRKYGTYYNPNNIYEAWFWKKLVDLVFSSNCLIGAFVFVD